MPTLVNDDHPLLLPRPDYARVDNSDDDVNFFAAHGYLVMKSGFPSDFIDRMAEWTRRRFWSPSGEQLQRRLQDQWKTEPDVRAAALHQPILDMLHKLYGRMPVPFQTLNFPIGTEQLTHSDTIHFHCFPQRLMCAAWVAFEPVHEGNGPLHYYPGSHRLPTLECADFGVDGWAAKENPELYQRQYQRYERAIQQLIEESGLRKETVNLDRGDVFIWAANLLHGGDAIRTPGSTRMSQVTHYYFEGGRYYTPLVSDLPTGKIHFRDALQNIATAERVIQSRPHASDPGIRESSSLLIKAVGRLLKSALHRSGPR